MEDGDPLGVPFGSTFFAVPSLALSLIACLALSDYC